MKRSLSRTDNIDLLLVAACKREDRATGETVGDALLQLEHVERRDEFVDFASRHGVLGLVSGSLLRRADLPGSGTKQWLQQIRRGFQRRAIVLQLERDRALRILSDAGVDAVVLKGAGLASAVFDSPADRDYGDIDVLVDARQTDAAVAALADNGYVVPGPAGDMDGYRGYHFHLRMQSPAGTLVEVHWAITGKDEPFKLDPSVFLAEAVSHPTVPRAKLPRAEHALLHVVAENVRDCFTRLTRLVDVDRIIATAPHMDWSYLESHARAAGLLPTLSLALTTSQLLLETEIPADVLSRIASTRSVRTHVRLLEVPRSLVAQRAIRRTSWGLLLQLWLVDDRSRLSALARIWRGDDIEQLEWLWAGEDEPRAVHGGLAYRSARAGKIIAYQLGTYATALVGRR